MKREITIKIKDMDLQTLEYDLVDHRSSTFLILTTHEDGYDYVTKIPYYNILWVSYSEESDEN